MLLRQLLPRSLRCAIGRCSEREARWVVAQRLAPQVWTDAARLFTQHVERASVFVGRRNGGTLLVRDETVGLYKGARADVRWVSFVVLVENGMNHDRLAMNGEDGVGRYVDPIL